VTDVAVVGPDVATDLERNAYPPGVVGVPCSDMARYHLFTTSLTMLDVPDNTDIAIHSSASVVENMNTICRHMPDHAEWLWIVGDDHTFPRNIVLKLLAHDVDIVALCARRTPPFSLVAFDTGGNGEVDEHGRPLYHVMGYDEIPDEPLVEIAAAGTAGMLIKREVIDRMGFPWFQNSDGFTINEDVEFCRRARELGYTIHLDTTIAIGHLGVVAVVPATRGGMRGFSLNFPGGGGNNEIFIPGGVRPDDQGTSDARTGTLDW
jgi:hypothetical protein